MFNNKRVLIILILTLIAGGVFVYNTNINKKFTKAKLVYGVYHGKSIYTT